MIKEIPKEICKAIRSQQYIHNTYIIVKELVENSLDAHATQVNIQVGDTLVVEDNGDGIEDLSKVCRCGYTSKEDTSYSVLGIENRDVGFSHGFRGQALAAISELCDVEISTKMNLQGSDKEHTRDSGLGCIKDFRTGATRPHPREAGTTVKVHSLFRNCAIRRQLNEKSKRKNLIQIISLLQSFCYVYNVHFTVLDRGKLIFASQGSENTREYAIKKHGDVYLESVDDTFRFMLFPLCKDKSQVIKLEKRVVSCGRISNMLNSIFKRYFDYQPTFVLLLNGEADVNVSVDKTEVVIKDFKYIEHKISSEMDLYFSQRLFVHEAPKRLKPEVPESQRLSTDEPSQSITNTSANKSQESNPGVYECTVNGDGSIGFTVRYDGPEPQVEGLCVGTVPSAAAVQRSSSGTADVLETIDGHRNPTNANVRERDISSMSDSTCLLNSKDTVAQGLLKTVTSQNLEASKNDNLPVSAYSFLKEEILEHPNVSIQKEDFRDMKILGQFNQGFILCTLKKDDCVLLITVDQHAADEIYNFERLKQSFFLKKQRLIAPVDLDITPLQELIIEDNTAVFERNGFTMDGRKLLTLPVYKGYFFTVKDFFSLLENISNGVYESEKFKDIMASKACRTSVMIGSKLTLPEMRRIVDSLSTLNLPWNCPHGRPTFKIITKL